MLAVQESSASFVEQHRTLLVRGSSVVDSAGAPVRLRGMSLFWSQWMPQFWTDRALAEGGLARHARAGRDGGRARGLSLEHPAREKARVEAVVNAGIDAGIYVIIDWHDHHAEDHFVQAKQFFSEMAQKYGGYPNVLFEVYNEPL